MSSTGLGLAWQVLTVEGPRAFRDRLRDRWAARTRQRSFQQVAIDKRDREPAAMAPLAQVPVLNVLSTPPRPDLGGVQVQLLRRLAAEERHRPWALLTPAGEGYRLEICSTRGRQSVALMAALPSPEQLECPDFEWAVRAAAARVGATCIHFEQLVGWPLVSVSGLMSEGFRLVVSVHDFGLFCLRPHLLERPMMKFCDFSGDADRCTRCLRCDWAVESDFQARRRAVARQLLAAAAAVVYPSDFLRRSYRELIPGLEPAGQHVVEPATRGEALASPEPRVRRGSHQQFHGAYVGSVKPHKGASEFEQLVKRLQDAPVRWTVFGGGDAEMLRRLRRLPNVHIRGYYRADELPAMLAASGVDLALLLSTWPESYALTFDECLRAGVPALAFDHGAIGDRLRRCGGGALIPPGAGVDGVERIVRKVLERSPGDDAVLTQIAEDLDLPDGQSASEAMRAIYRELGIS
ncbi:MAG: glycosyltransferase [Acidobacteriota bacterium]